MQNIGYKFDTNNNQTDEEFVVDFNVETRFLLIGNEKSRIDNLLRVLIENSILSGKRTILIDRSGELTTFVTPFIPMEQSKVIQKIKSKSSKKILSHIYPLIWVFNTPVKKKSRNVLKFYFPLVKILFDVAKFSPDNDILSKVCDKLVRVSLGKLYQKKRDSVNLFTRYIVEVIKTLVVSGNKPTSWSEFKESLIKPIKLQKQISSSINSDDLAKFIELLNNYVEHSRLFEGGINNIADLDDIPVGSANLQVVYLQDLNDPEKDLVTDLLLILHYLESFSNGKDVHGPISNIIFDQGFTFVLDCADTLFYKDDAGQNTTSMNLLKTFLSRIISTRSDSIISFRNPENMDIDLFKEVFIKNCPSNCVDLNLFVGKVKIKDNVVILIKRLGFEPERNLDPFELTRGRFIYKKGLDKTPPFLVEPREPLIPPVTVKDKQLTSILSRGVLVSPIKGKKLEIKSKKVIPKVARVDVSTEVGDSSSSFTEAIKEATSAEKIESESLIEDNVPVIEKDDSLILDAGVSRTGDHFEVRPSLTDQVPMGTQDRLPASTDVSIEELQPSGNLKPAIESEEMNITGVTGDEMETFEKFEIDTAIHGTEAVLGTKDPSSEKILPEKELDQLNIDKEPVIEVEPADSPSNIDDSGSRIEEEPKIEVEPVDLSPSADVSEPAIEDESKIEIEAVEPMFEAQDDYIEPEGSMSEIDDLLENLEERVDSSEAFLKELIDLEQATIVVKHKKKEIVAELNYNLILDILLYKLEKVVKKPYGRDFFVELIKKGSVNFERAM
ncbi:MAG: hypothetical protein ACTSRA_17765, partial [Promethearchaeota archaeon]